MKTQVVIFPFLIYCILFIVGISPANANEKEIDFGEDYFYKKLDKNAAEISQQIQQSLTRESISPTRKYFLTHNLAYTHFRLNNKSQALETFTQSIKLAQALDNYHQAKSYHRRALTYGILLRDTETAMLDLKNAIALINQSKHSDANSLHFDLLTSMSQAYNQKADLINAKLYIDQALSLANVSKDNENKIYALVILGRILWQENNIPEATDAYLQALQLTTLDTPKGRIASIELRLAKIYLASNVFEQSLKYAEKSVQLYQEINNKRLQIKAIQVLGDIHLNLNKDLNKAIMYYLNALDIAIELEAQHAIGELQHLIGAAYIQERNFKSAQKYLDAATKTLEDSNEKYYSGLNYIEKAKLSHELGDTNTAVLILKQLLQNNKLASYPKAEFSAKSQLIDYLQNLALYQDAVKLQNEQVDYLRSLLSKSDADNVNLLQKEIEIKTLKTKIDALIKEQTSNKELIAKQKKIQTILYIILILLTFIVYYLFFIIRNKGKTPLFATQNNHNSWSSFLETLISTRHSNKKNNKTEAINGGLLVSIPNINKQINKDPCHLTFNKDITRWHQTLSDSIDSQIYAQHMLEQWMYLSKEPKFNEELSSQLLASLGSLSVTLVWFPFENIPEHFSEDIQHLVEKLIYKACNEANHDNALSYSTVTLQKQSLAIVFNQSDSANIDEKINHASALGLIRCDNKVIL